VQTEISRIYLTAPVGPLRILKVLTDGSCAHQEYCFHRRVQFAFLTVAQELNGNGLEINLPYIPKLFAFYPNLRDTQYGGMIQGLEDTSENCGIKMEYIRPFTKDTLSLY